MIMDNYNQNPYQQQQPQPQYQQPQYQQPIYNAPQQDPASQVMSVGQYIGLFILSAIPVVNVICWIVWLCSPNTNKNKKNYIIANIVIWIITAVLSIIAAVAMAAMGVAVSGGF